MWLRGLRWGGLLTFLPFISFSFTFERIRAVHRGAGLFAGSGACCAPLHCIGGGCAGMALALGALVLGCVDVWAVHVMWQQLLRGLG